MIDFLKRKYKIFIPIMVLFVLLIAFYFLYKEYQYDNKRNKQEVSVFQYFGGMKTEYTAIVTYNLKKCIVDVSAKDKKIEYDATPIYYKKGDKIIFPKEMSLVYPLKNASQYRLFKYSTYQMDEDVSVITNGTNTIKDNYYFLYDGHGLFFFPEEVTININGNEYRKLSPMSYVSIVGGYTMTYYDYEKDESAVIEIEGKKISASSENMDINLSERYCVSFGKKVLLANPADLNEAK